MGKILLGCGLLLSSLAIVGCGGSSSDDDDDGGGSGIENMPSSLARTLCKLTYQCCTNAQRAENPFVGDTEAECRSNISAFLTLGVPDLNRSISKGRMRYDGGALSSCLAQLEAAGCNAVAVDPAQCDGVFVPLVESGGACTHHDECIDGVCHGGDSTNDMDGTCGTPLPDGADCVDSDECASGYCDRLSCAAQAPNGGSCTSDEECASEVCDADGFCAPSSSSVCE